MVDILHRVGTKTPTPEKVYDALTTVEGLAGWWTEDTKGSGDLGGVLAFRFPVGGFDMEVVELRPAERVAWRVVDGPEEWVGTTVGWDLRQNGDYTKNFRSQAGPPWVFRRPCGRLVAPAAGRPSPAEMRHFDASCMVDGPMVHEGHETP